ncbi:MAG: ABC transporter permease subunit [Caldilineaceae bacterium]|nr:ABC transporter permease subunit [Caldilineaceae bacterium]
MLSEQTTRPPNLAAQVQAEDQHRVAGGWPLLRRIVTRIITVIDRRLSNWFVPLGILLAWQLLVQFGFIPERILPAPSAIARAAVRLTLSGQLLADVLVSTQRALTGLLVGGGLAFALGLVNGMSARSEKYLDTTIQMIRTIPNLALVPLVILWFGIGDEARLFLIALGVFFPIYINTFHGVRQVDSGLIEMGRTYGLSTWQLFRQIIFPGAMPSILLGLRIALGVMWLTLIVAETVAVDSGIGYLAQSAREFIRTDVMVFAVILYALLGKLADVIARALEQRLLQWHTGYQQAEQRGGSL